jgi:ElaB/YqjD/DUF883 family membrane-anchored ribosome-binding protein
MAETDTMRRPGMGVDSESLGDKVSTAANQAKDYAADAASQAKEKAAELSRTAAAKIDEGRLGAASSMQGAASSLRTSGQSTGEAISSFANTAADKLENSAAYVREHNVNQMMGDVEQLVRRNPGPSLIAAAAVGFLLGAALRPKD